MQISPGSVRMQVPEKCEIPDFFRVGELFYTECSSVLIHLFDLLGLFNSMI